MTKHLALRRVAVTGVGWVTSLGCDIGSTWQALLAGKSGIQAIQHLEHIDNMRAKICGLVQGFCADDYLSAKDQRKMDPFIQYGVAAADDALRQSGLPLERVAQDTGVAFGSGIGGLSTIEHNHNTVLNQGVRRITPFFIPATIINMVAGNISIRHGLQGPNISVVTACTTGTHNIGLAARMIASGEITAMVAGGSEFASTILGLGGFSAIKALSARNDDPARASRPWDKDRDGFVLSDGAGAMVLEDYEHAKARGANILAEVVGFGMGGDAYHMTAPDAEGVGAIRVMRSALKSAGIAPTDVQVVNAHGTSTKANDRIETAAIRQVFGAHADSLKVHSVKSMLGHSLGATGAIEAIVSVLTLRDQYVPGTINCDQPDVDCDLDYVRHGSVEADVRYVLSNSFGFGGTNGTLIFKRAD